MGFSLVVAMGLTMVWPYAVAEAEESAFAVPSGQRQLFLDDVGIAEIENLVRTMHRPQKRGGVIRSPDPRKTIQTRTAPVWDPQDKVYRTWVLTIAENLWESGDGLNWIPGPNPNIRISMAVYDPNDPDPLRRYKAPLLNRGFAVSPDGVQWTPLDLPKIHSSDEGNFTYDPTEGLFIHTVKRSGPFGRSVAAATSRDFTNWTDLGVVFHADEQDQQLGREHIKARFADANLHHPPYNDPNVYNVDVYNMGVFRYGGLYIGLPAMYHATGPVPNYPNTVGFHLVQLACSRDLKMWRRLGDRQTFIGPSHLDSGAYDLTQILPPSAPVVRGDELWFYYTGLKYRGSFRYVGKYPEGETIPIPGRDRDAGAICLAVLRRDGFMSLDAGDQQGTVLTRPFTAPGDRLLVNVDAPEGELTVEVLDSGGAVLATSLPISGDFPQERVKWTDNAQPTLEGQVVVLRFTIRNGKFYSYWFE